MKQLFGNNVAIEPILEEDDKTVGGIVIPGKKGQQRQLGKVVAVGKGLLLNNGKRAPMDIEVGMTVIYRQYAGIQVLDGEKKLLVMSAKDVIAEV